MFQPVLLDHKTQELTITGKGTRKKSVENSTLGVDPLPMVESVKKTLSKMA